MSIQPHRSIFRELAAPPPVGAVLDFPDKLPRSAKGFDFRKMKKHKIKTFKLSNSAQPLKRSKEKIRGGNRWTLFRST